MNVITPTIGRIVWFWENVETRDLEHAQPEAAVVTYVHSDRCVNLTVFDHNGFPRSVTSVELRQPGDQTFPQGFFCEWMPYQIGQARKHTAESDGDCGSA